MAFLSDQAWLQQLSNSETNLALGMVMTAWFAEVKRSRQSSGSLGVEYYMQSGDWQSARGSLERSYGRSSNSYRHLTDMLSAAIQHRNILALRV